MLAVVVRTVWGAGHIILRIKTVFEPGGGEPVIKLLGVPLVFFEQSGVAWL